MQAARERAASFLMFFFMMIASFLSCRACGRSVSIVCRRGFPLSTVISYQVNLNRTFEAKIFFRGAKNDKKRAFAARINMIQYHHHFMEGGKNGP